MTCRTFQSNPSSPVAGHESTKPQSLKNSRQPKKNKVVFKSSLIIDSLPQTRQTRSLSLSSLSPLQLLQLLQLL